jgi:hypothetical protein
MQRSVIQESETDTDTDTDTARGGASHSYLHQTLPQIQRLAIQEEASSHLAPFLHSDVTTTRHTLLGRNALPLPQARHYHPQRWGDQSTPSTATAIVLLQPCGATHCETSRLQPQQWRTA